jgi:hypothetical protein
VIITIATLLSLAVIGLPFALLVTPGRNASFIIGFSFLIGAGVSGVTLFVILAVAHLLPGMLGPVFVTVILVIATAGVLIVRRRTSSLPTPALTDTSRERGISWLLDVVSLILMIAHAFYATSARLWEWDYLADWGLKAKVFFRYGRIDWSFLQFHDYAFMQPDYPPLVPLLLDVLAVMRGAWEDRWAGLIYTAMGVATVLVVRGMAQLETRSRLQASFLTLAITAPALTIWVGLGEGFVAAYATAAVVLMRFAIRRGVFFGDRAYLAGAMLLGFAMLSKNEGTAFFISTVIAVLLTVRPPWKALMNLWPALALFLPWMVIRAMFDFAPVYFQEGVLRRLGRHITQTPEILAALVRFPPDKEWMWIALLLILIIRAAWIWRNERFLATLLVTQVGIYVAQNFLTPFGVLDHIAFSWHRLCYQIAPLAITLALLALRPWMVAVRKSAAETSPSAGFPHLPHPSTD